jgi:hypothetical protein
VDTTQQRLLGLGLGLQNVVADAGYSSGENYAQLESRGLVGFTPPHGKYKAQRLGFTYNTLTDKYFCSQGKRLAFDRLVVNRPGNARHRYVAKRADCRCCPVNVALACKGKTP